jgi:hypothetical protein
MRTWDKWVAYLSGGILCLMAIGHGIAFAGMSKSLGATAIDQEHADAIRAVWLSISVTFASFGLLLLRAARQTRQADWLVIASIGFVLILSGSAGLAVSSGQPFWWQHIVVCWARRFLPSAGERRSRVCSNAQRARRDAQTGPSAD